MLVSRDLDHYDRLRPYISGKRLLMLGNHGVEEELSSGDMLFDAAVYRTLDLDDGDYAFDLSSDICHQLDQQWDVVFNLGTIEHVWDVHAAYSNAARMVAVGGVFIGHAPVGGDYAEHGMHLTNGKAILRFFQRNGFEILEHWICEHDILWHVARKLEHVERFQPPMHVWDSMIWTDIT